MTVVQAPGLYDYWEMMRKHPRCVGGFIWVLADEGVKRTDKNGFIDNVGNFGADGIVGPHHEKEGSYYTVRQVWCPVQVMNRHIDATFDGKLQVENRYEFSESEQLPVCLPLRPVAHCRRYRNGDEGS